MREWYLHRKSLYARASFYLVQICIYRVAIPVDSNLLLTPEQRLRCSTWATYRNGTFVLMSTGGLNQSDWSPCTLQQHYSDEMLIMKDPSTSILIASSLVGKDIIVDGDDDRRMYFIKIVSIEWLHRVLCSVRKTDAVLTPESAKNPPYTEFSSDSRTPPLLFMNRGFNP